MAPENTPSQRPRPARFGGLVPLAIGLLCLVRGVDSGGGEARPTVDTSRLPLPASPPIDYDRDIKPIFEAACLRCHGTERPRSGFSLATREAALKGGDNGVDIVSGQSAQSPLIHYVAGLIEDMRMPPGQTPPLTEAQIAQLRAWIDQGVPWSTNAPARQFQFAVTPTLRWIGVSGNAAQFRELYWTKDGWSGGVSQFQLKQTYGVDGSITVEGRALPGPHDFQIAMTLDKRNLGFARFGYEEYRKYDDDTGGYYPGFDPSVFRLDRGLSLDIGRAWTEIGLTLPHWPRMVLGYEYQFKEGALATLQWGDVTDSNYVNKKIYPSLENLDEKVHLLKLDVSHQIAGFRLEDNARAEFYGLNESRANDVTLLLGKEGPDKLELAREDYHHVQAANTFRAERHFTDWLFASAGYFYSHLEGDVGFHLDTALTPAADLPPTTSYGFDKFWFSRHILLSQQSHYLNANSLWGPWQGLSLAAGVQTHWMRQTGIGDVDVDKGDPTDPANFLVQPALLRSDLDEFSTDEQFSLRYTKIPYTVLFADAHFQQDSLGQYEEQNGGMDDFLSRTDVTSDRKEYRAGFTVSPWQRISFTAHLKRQDKRSDYDHGLDLVRGFGATFPGEGYPAFLRSRRILTDEAAAKMVVQPARWLKTTLTYQILAADYRTATDPVSGDVSPGGSLLAGNYDAQVYSANAALTPWRRLTLSSTFSYRRTRTLTAANNLDAVVPYRGNVYSVLTSASYALAPSADLQASYSFSRADYGQNPADGLPYGAVYAWHGLQLGLTQRFKKNLTTMVQYAFYNYDEPAAGSLRNFTAHAVFWSLTKRFP
jgi:hypothetical protein